MGIRTAASPSLMNGKVSNTLEVRFYVEFYNLQNITKSLLSGVDIPEFKVWFILERLNLITSLPLNIVIWQAKV